jgi:uncharacterized protein YjbI with pentapeptide repeats
MIDFMKLTYILALAVVVSLSAAVENSDDMKVIQASQILSSIEDGEPINLEYVIIVGDLDLQKINLPLDGSIKSSITIRNSIINGAFKFNNTILQRPIKVDRTKISGFTSFFQTQFKEDFDFSDSLFNDTAIFRKTQFDGSADFGRSKFVKLADFFKCNFGGESANFEGTEFEGPADFYGAQFEVEKANFEFSRFKGSTSFWRTKFSGFTDFIGCHFNESADFNFAQFKGPADFVGVVSDKKIYFNDVEFATLKVNWASIMDSLVCNGPSYLRLVKSFREQEQFEDADSCYYYYRNWKRDNRQLGWPMLFDYIAWVSCGYGVRWHHTILSGFLVVILFGIYFEIGYTVRAATNLILKKNLISSMSYDLTGRLKKSTSISAMILLSLPPEWYPSRSESYKKLVESHIYSATSERLIGWGLMLLLIGTLSRLMVRY